jgi:hypothetical protein
LFSLDLNNFLDLKKMIFESTAGHIGLIQNILEVVAQFITLNMHAGKSSDDFWTEEKLKELLTSGLMENSIQQCRAVCLDDTDDLIAPIANEFLDGFDDQILYDSKKHDWFVKLGIFNVKVDIDKQTHYINFTAPLIRRAFIMKSFQPLVYNEYYKMPIILKDFVIDCLCKLRKSNLLSSNALLTCGGLNEAKFRLEFFFIARSLLGSRGGKIDPEVGRVFQASNDAVDFYINGKYKWAIEFLVEGDRLGSHLKRFNEGESYLAIPRHQHIVVNFMNKKGLPVNTSKYVCTQKNEFLNVWYTPSFDNLMVQYEDEEKFVITIQE